MADRCLEARAARFGIVRIEQIATWTLKDGQLVHRDDPVAAGFDVADLVAEGITWDMLVGHFGEENLIDWIEPPQDAGIPDGYALENGRLCRLVKGQEGEIEKVELCSWIRVAGLARDRNSQSWEILVQLRDPDGLVHEELIPYAELAGDGTAAFARLKNRGLRSTAAKGVKNAILSCLELWDTPHRIRMVPSAGHHDGRFVTPDKVYGPFKGETLRLDRRNVKPGQIAEYKGTKEQADELAKLCVGNSRLVLAMAAAFVGPLLYLLGAEGGGIHFYCESSVGKTTLLKIVKTILGLLMQTWRGTDNGLEGIATNHSDLLLVLDEIGEADRRVVGRVVYMLANGTGKIRADARGEARSPKT